MGEEVDVNKPPYICMVCVAEESVAEFLVEPDRLYLAVIFLCVLDAPRCLKHCFSCCNEDSISACLWWWGGQGRDCQSLKMN